MSVQTIYLLIGRKCISSNWIYDDSSQMFRTKLTLVFQIFLHLGIKHDIQEQFRFSAQARISMKMFLALLSISLFLASRADLAGTCSNSYETYKPKFRVYKKEPLKCIYCYYWLPEYNMLNPLTRKILTYIEMTIDYWAFIDWNSPC